MINNSNHPYPTHLSISPKDVKKKNEEIQVLWNFKSVYKFNQTWNEASLVLSGIRLFLYFNFVQLETMAKSFDIQESIRYLLLILAQYISLDKQSQGFVHNLIGRERKEWTVSGYIYGRSMWSRFTHSEMVLKWAMRVTEDLEALKFEVFKTPQIVRYIGSWQCTHLI